MATPISPVMLHLSQIEHYWSFSQTRMSDRLLIIMLACVTFESDEWLADFLVQIADMLLLIRWSWTYPSECYIWRRHAEHVHLQNFGFLMQWCRDSSIYPLKQPPNIPYKFVIYSDITSNSPCSWAWILYIYIYIYIYIINCSETSMSAGIIFGQYRHECLNSKQQLFF